MKLKLDHTKQQTPDVITFYFTPEENFEWKAGQFMHYRLEHENPDERGVERYFTISSAPHEKFVSITTRFSNDGSSLKKILRALPLQGVIQAEGPEGDYVIQDPHAQHVFIVGGIGVTPVRSILTDLDHRQLPINATLLYANRDQNIVFKQELEMLAERHPHLKIQYFINPLKIDAQALEKVAKQFPDAVYYISGPEQMMISFRDILKSFGISDERIKADFFPGYGS